MIKKPTDLTNLKKVVLEAAKTGKKLKTIIETLSADQAKERAKIIDNNLAMLPADKQRELKPTFEAAFKDWQRGWLKANDEVRYNGLRSLTAAHEALSYARDTLCNPIKLASIHNLGSENRARIEASVRNAGPMTLKSLAETAELTGDKDMASALIAVNDSRARPDRGFTSQELAAKVWAVEVKQAKELCETMDIEHRRAVKLNRFIEGKAPTAFESLEEGLTFGPDGIEKKEVPLKKDSDVANGLEILNQLARDNKVEDEPFDVTWARILKEASAA